MKTYTSPAPYGARYVDRDERRGANSKPRNMQPPQSRQAVNLSRLSAELGADVLGAALGLAEPSLRVLLDGRNPGQEAQYQPHMEHKFEDAGIPLGWLNREHPTLEPEYLQALRMLAAQAPNKAPMRRANFRRLAKAFDGRIGVLADAVEMHQAAVMNVAEGHLELDDYRFNHLNPRLMRAGFPDSWLEEPNPDLSDSMLESLEQLALDGYEQELSSSEAIEQTVGQAFVSPAPAQVVAAQQQLAAVAAPISPVTTAPIAPKKEKTMEPSDQPQLPQEGGALLGFAKPEFSAAGFPGATPSMPHPAAVAHKVPSRLLAAGRKVAGVGVKGAGVGQPVGKAPAMPVPAAQAAPVKTKTAISKDASLARANALNQLLDTARRGAKDALWTHLMGLSLPYWGNIRRGTVLFRDELANRVLDALELPQGWLDTPTFPPATLATWVMDPAVPLPGSEAKKAAKEAKPEAPAPQVAVKAPGLVKPFARPKTVAQVQILEPVVPEAELPKPQPQVAVADIVAPAPVVEPEAAAPAVTAVVPVAMTAPAASVAAPVVEASAAAPVKISLAGFKWSPPQGQPGPICQALVSTLNGMSASGVLTEQDALQMLNQLLGRS